MRVGNDTKLLIALNLTDEPRRLACRGAGTLLLSTYLDGESEPVEASRLLRPNEGIIIKLRS
jgi:hypothetical protein